MTKNKTHEWDMDIGKGFHPAADVFPEMTEEEFAGFLYDVKENGLQNPIVTTKDGLILDGRHRWRACMQLKIEPKYQIYAGDPWRYVVSANLHRRHLTTSQRAMVAGRIAEATVGRQPVRAASIDRIRQIDGRDPSHAVTNRQAAELLKVGVSSIVDAKRVVTRGIPELNKLVDDGIDSVSNAARIALTLDGDQQLEYVQRVRGQESPALAFSAVRDVDIPEPKPVERHRKIAPAEGFNRKQAQALMSTLVGVEAAFRNVNSITNLPADEAHELTRQIGRAKTVLNRLQDLLKEVWDK